MEPFYIAFVVVVLLATGAIIWAILDMRKDRRNNKWRKDD